MLNSTPCIANIWQDELSFVNKERMCIYCFCEYGKFVCLNFELLSTFHEYYCPNLITSAVSFWLAQSVGVEVIHLTRIFVVIRCTHKIAVQIHWPHQLTMINERLSFFGEILITRNLYFVDSKCIRDSNLSFILRTQTTVMPSELECQNRNAGRWKEIIAVSRAGIGLHFNLKFKWARRIYLIWLRFAFLIDRSHPIRCPPFVASWNNNTFVKAAFLEISVGQLKSQFVTSVQVPVVSIP